MGQKSTLRQSSKSNPRSPALLRHLKREAIEAAGDLGHYLGRFGKQHGRNPVWIARCNDCSGAVIIEPHLFLADGKGFGGSATKRKCTAEYGASEQAYEDYMKPPLLDMDAPVT